MPGLLEPLTSASLLVPLSSAQAIDDGLTGHWSATSSQSFVDLSGNGRDLDPAVGSNPAVIVPESTEYNGSHAYDTGSFQAYMETLGPIVDPEGDWTVSLWMKEHSANTGDAQLMQISSATNVSGNTHLYFHRSNGVRLTTATNQFGTFFVINDDLWNHYTVTNSPGRSRKWYLNGVFQEEKVGTTDLSTANNLYFSRGFNGYVRGWFDSMRAYDRVLSESEITELFNGGRNEAFGPPPGEDVDITAIAGATNTSGQAPTLQIGQNVDLVALAGTSVSAGQTPILEAQKNVDVAAAVGTTDTSGQAPTLQIGANVDITVQAGQSISQGRIPQLVVGGNVQLTAQPGFTHSQGQTPILQIQENVDLVAIAGQSVTVGQTPSLIAGGGISMAAMAVSTQVIQAQIDA